MASIAPQAIWRTDGMLGLKFPYSPWIVDQLKTMIPAWGRQWRPEEKAWLIERSYADVAVRLLRQAFGDVVIIGQAQTSYSPFSSSPPAVDSDCQTLYVLPNAPARVVDAAYRALARELHPDVGGNHESMLALNGAYERLAKRAAS